MNLRPWKGAEVALPARDRPRPCRASLSSRIRRPVLEKTRRLSIKLFAGTEADRRVGTAELACPGRPKAERQDSLGGARKDRLRGSRKAEEPQHPLAAAGAAGRQP